MNVFLQLAAWDEGDDDPDDPTCERFLRMEVEAYALPDLMNHLGGVVAQELQKLGIPRRPMEIELEDLKHGHEDLR